MNGINVAALVLGFPAFLLSLTVHEYAHAWMASRLGDHTAAWMGRLTLDPRAHIDPVGTLLFPILGLASGGVLFGWAKPVPFVPRNLKNPMRDTMLIALAGPVSNIILALISLILFRILMLTGGLASGGLLESGGGAEAIWGAVATFLLYALMINTILAVFNMVPIHPLDGSKVLTYFLPYPLQNSYRALEPYGMIILIGFMITGVFGRISHPAISLVMAAAGISG